ncbi:MAG: hypothetical protein BJ554DRAFT_5468 [Olpidium bornovanus]|uniref:Uncharacterized protein n=1 Tax=Olpidium bornovanus TaxID=278681 RepID=A0A8H8DL00_9FUNG|nr:MAG: hypothetical protein BJ554DRAFT_5468 [Olpidium bornovanus]
MGNPADVEEGTEGPPLVSVFCYRDSDAVPVDLLMLPRFELVQEYLQRRLGLAPADDPLLFEYVDVNDMRIVCAGADGWRVLLEDLRSLSPRQRVVKVARKKRYYDDIAQTAPLEDEYYFSSDLHGLEGTL